MYKRQNNKIQEGDLFPLRPCPEDAIKPAELKNIINKELINDIPEGEVVKWNDLK